MAYIYRCLFMLKYYIWAIACLFFGIFVKYNWSNQYQSGSSVNYSYNYIVVGAGTAGCVVAARLSELQNVSILLIEAGSDIGYLSKIPIAPTLLQNGPADWAFRTTPQKYSSNGLYDNIQFLPRGKGLGGSGQINYFLHGLGEPDDYNNWNIDGWRYIDLLPYFHKTFNNRKKNISKIRLSKNDVVLDTITNIFTESSIQLKSVKMYTKPFHNTIFRGERESTYSRYLRPYLFKRNLHILSNALVSKIVFQEDMAHSVEIILPNDKPRYIHAQNEIILSSGAIKTPQLLMLSGIGPEVELSKHNITMVVKNDNVGRNLHDHLNMPLYIEINKPISVTLDKIKSIQSIFDYFWFGKGYLSTPAVVGIGKGQSHSAIILFALGSTDEDLLRDVSNLKTETYRTLFPFYNDSKKEGFLFLSTCLQPQSRGNIILKNDNPNAAPIINPDYLSQKSDVDCIINAIRMAIEVLKTPAFTEIGATIHWPDIAECKDLYDDEISDKYLECIIRSAALTGHHLGGTCSMGGSSSVVDKYLRVNGVSNLRIVDASILPAPISSPPNSVIISIAEKASELIKEHYRESVKN